MKQSAAGVLKQTKMICPNSSLARHPITLVHPFAVGSWLLLSKPHALTAPKYLHQLSPVGEGYHANIASSYNESLGLVCRKQPGTELGN